jgi:hypothetical protein
MSRTACRSTACKPAGPSGGLARGPPRPPIDLLPPLHLRRRRFASGTGATGKHRHDERAAPRSDGRRASVEAGSTADGRRRCCRAPWRGLARKLLCWPPRRWLDQATSTGGRARPARLWAVADGPRPLERRPAARVPRRSSARYGTAVVL